MIFQIWFFVRKKRIGFKKNFSDLNFLLEQRIGFEKNFSDQNFC